MNQIKIFTPATIANIGCGFDILGFAFSSLGDIVTLEKIEEKKIEITEVKGYSELPTEPEKNTVTIPILRIMSDYNLDFGVRVKIKKNIPIASGMGSSAAGAVAGSFGISYLAGKILSDKEILEYALEAEGTISGEKHADNIAPCYYGGITLIRNTEKLEIIKLPIPEDISCIIMHPHIEIKTEYARKLLKDLIETSKCIKQMANIASFIAGIFQNDKNLLSSANIDFIAEPHRAELIPKYYRLKESALKSGAIACNISGSGPSIFVLYHNNDTRNKIIDSIKKIYDKKKLNYDLYFGKISKIGVKIIEESNEVL
ncbi:MAG: homoserine kinase [Candidatus Marinimicrobia bacterium]|nr:homoserine kinase [Candidatus Neomarinimicrobiota bacterium]